MKFRESVKYIYIILITLLITGCSTTQPVVEKIVYRDKECPVPKQKPEFTPYEALVLEINGEEYYAFPKSEALKLVTNWISYREWAEANYLLIKIEDPKNIK